MKYLITDIIEPDNGCEGYLPGEEPLAVLILDNGRSIRVPDSTAYSKSWDTGKYIDDSDIDLYAVR